MPLPFAQQTTLGVVSRDAAVPPIGEQAKRDLRQERQKAEARKTRKLTRDRRKWARPRSGFGMGPSTAMLGEADVMRKTLLGE